MKEFLRHNGMYSPLSTSFLNLTASRCYRIYNVLGSDSKENFWNALHTEYAEGLGWQGREADEFEEKEVCAFVANVILYTHKQYKKRVSRGIRLNIDKLSGTVRNNFWKKLGAFFTSISLRKKKRVEKS